MSMSCCRTCLTEWERLLTIKDYYDSLVQTDDHDSIIHDNRKFAKRAFYCS